MYGFPEEGLQGECKPGSRGNLITLQITSTQLRIVTHPDKIKIL